MAELPFPEAVPELGISLHYPFGQGARHENLSALLLSPYCMKPEEACEEQQNQEHH